MAFEGSWKKSSFCNASLDCVEIRESNDPVIPMIFLRSSLAPERILGFTRAEWDAFTAGVKAGEFD